MKRLDILIFLNLTAYVFIEARVQQFVRLGSDVILRCPFYSTTNSLVWRGPPNLMTISINSLLGSHQADFNVISNVSTGQYHLFIRNISYKHEGLYQCDTVSNGQNVEFEIRLRFADPVSNITIFNSTDLRQIHGTEGSLLQLQCTVESGRPKPNISLVYNMTTLVTNTSSDFVSYSIQLQRHDHLNFIACTANNTFYFVEKKYQLVIKTKPWMNIVFMPSSTVDEGSEVEIWCENKTDDFSTRFVWRFEGNILMDQTDQNLKLLNVSTDKAGIYSCQTENAIGLGIASSNLNIRYSPLFIDSNSKLKVNAKLGSPSNIEFSISSFPKPSVSWLDNAEGKVSPWTISVTNETTYYLRSTIVPEKENHIGEYNIKVRNAMGSLHLTVRLIGTDVQIYPQLFICNMFSDIILSCKMNSSAMVQVENWWTHTFYTIYIRNLSGTFENGSSILTIPYCDYRDEGNYTCNWKLSDNIYSSTTSVTIRGLPIKSKKKVIVEANQVNFELFFIATPIFDKIEWLYKDMPVSFQHNTSTTETCVNLTIHGNVITKQGYVSTLSLPSGMKFESKMYSCIVRNSFGILETAFTKQDVFIMKPSRDDETTSTEIMSICGGLNRCHFQTTEFNHDIMSTGNFITERHFFIIVIAIILGVLVAITVIFLSKHLKKRRRGPEVINSNPVEIDRPSDVEEVYLEVCATPHGSYEEIGDVPHTCPGIDVHNHDSDEETDKSVSIVTQSSDSSKNNYDDFIGSRRDNHDYSDVEESL